MTAKKCRGCHLALPGGPRSAKREWHEDCKYRAYNAKRRAARNTKTTPEQRAEKRRGQTERLVEKAASGKTLSPEQQRDAFLYARAVELLRKENLPTSVLVERLGIPSSVAAQIRASVGLRPCTQGDWL